MTGKTQPTICVSTIIDSYNYGTVLQAVATRDALERYGKPVFIDYCRPQWTFKGGVKTYMSNRSHSVPSRVARLVANIPVRHKTRKLFRSFVERELALCSPEPYLTNGEGLEPNAVYCVGSDQTWNIECNCGIDPVYFLQNVPAGYKKIAYSASFGRPSLGEGEAVLTKPLLDQFEAISVRESSSVAILEGMGLTGTALKDPVLLCRPELWSELSASVPRAAEGYVLVYMLNDNPAMCEFARLLARREGLRARIVKFRPFKRVPEGFEGVCLPAPEEWVALFRDATYVVTDSFHGTCFSLLFEHPMIVFDPPKFSVRLKDVLADFGLSTRRVDDGRDPMGIASQTIDWDAVRSKKAGFSTEARLFLDGVFGSCGGRS
jgi:hypothetical protein